MSSTSRPSTNRRLVAHPSGRRDTVYVRVARFEGRDTNAIDEQVASMKSQIDASRSGELPAGAPEQARTLMDTVTRFMEFVDRDTGTTLGITFCETEDDLRRASAALDEMSPPGGTGHRTSVESYEVALDESFA
jgi:hypothetical protein